jgi:Yip1 domain
VDTPSIPIPPHEPSVALSEPVRIVNTFIAPTKTFNDLKRSAAWWGPFVLSTIVTLIFVFVMDRQIGFEQLTRNAIAQSSRAEQFEKLPADQKAKQIAISTTITKYFSYASPVLAMIGMVVAAGVLLGVFNLGAGASVSFKTAWAIVWYGMLPWVVHAVLACVSMMGVDKEAFNPRNPVGTNPAYYMDPAGNKFLNGMVSALDIFAIWSIVLLGIGFACNSRVKRSTAIILVAVAYLVYKVVGSALGSFM